MASTIEDVAARAGVSTATVSRAMRGLDGVSKRSRDKVLEAARELGYVVSPTAQALATGHTGMIAVIVPTFNEWFSANVLEGAQRRLQSAGRLTAVLSASAVRGRPDYDVDVASLRRRIDGVVNVSLPLTDEETREVAGLGVPVIAVGNPSPPFASVSLADREAGRIATRHLVNLGHRVIAYISGSRDELEPNTPGGQRLEGWRDVLVEEGLEHGPDLVVNSFFDVRGGHDAVLELLERRPDVTAVFAAADMIATGAMVALSEYGLRVPEDISIIGVDGDDTDPWVQLTTVVQDPAEMGAMAADLLLQIIGGGAVPEMTLVHGRLRPGRTTARPRDPEAADASPRRPPRR
jgi:DNA-binding LacI/PurR family transcriptional regulator